MRRPGLVLFTLLAFAATPGAQAPAKIAAGQEGPFAIPDCKFPGVLYVPSDYVAGRRLPLIFFLHGSGGEPTSWPWKTATNGKGYFIAGLPYGAQADAGSGGIRSDHATRNDMVKLIDRARGAIDDAYGIDQTNVVLSGLSMGGWGVNYYGFYEPARGRYSGYAIIAAGPRPGTDVDFSITEGLPVLLLNGAKDNNLPVANQGKPLVERAGAIVTQVIIPDEGHVPSVQSMATPLREWLANVDTLRQNRSAMAAVQWTDLPPRDAVPAARGADALAAHLAKLPLLAEAADRPVLVYAYSTATKKNGKPTRSATRSHKVADASFVFPGGCEVPIASRSFHCCRVDLGALTKREHPHLSESMAPFVLLLAPDRTLSAQLKGSISERALLGKMTALLGPTATDAITAKAKSFRPILAEFAKQQKKRESLVTALSKLRRAKKPSSKKIGAKTEELVALDIALDALREKLAH